MADPYDVIRDEFDREVRIDYLTNSTHEITTGGFGGNQLKWTVNWITIEPSGFLYFCGDPGTCIFSPLLTVVDSIVIPSTPAGRSYQFEYQTPAMGGHGELTKITLPSDAAATYKYEKHDMFTMGGQLSRGSVDTLRNRIIQKDLTYTEIHDAVPTARADTWSYSYDKTAPEFSTTITNPDGGNVQQFFIDPDNATNPLTGSVYKVVQPNGDTIERYWERNLPSGVASTHVNPGNPYVRAEYLTVAGASPKTNAKLFTHNQNGNLTQVAEYDWGVTVPRDPQNNNIPNGVPSGTPVRTTTNSYFASTPNASNVTTPSLAEAFAYWNPDNSATLLNAVNITEGRQGGATGSVKAKTAFIYDNAQTTGNVTKKTDGVGSTIDTEMTYTASGNVKTVTDPNNSVTEFTYGSMCTGSDLYPTQRKDANGTSLVRTFTFTYDCDTGLKDFETDLDNVVTTDFDYDDFGRPTETVAFSNDASGTLKRKTTTEYNDSNRTVRVRSDLDGFGDGKLVAVAHFDQLGRQRLLRTTDGTIIPATPDTSGIKVQTRHLVSGSNTYQLASNPFRATTSLNASGEGAMGWTRTKFDQNGRVDEVETFAPPVTPAGTIADLPAPWGSNTSSTGKLTTNYNADHTTVTDQAGKVRRSTTDGLGRLKIVDEDPNGLDYTTNPAFSI